MDMERLLQVIADGLADGSVYGALGLALALIYRSTGIINFAQGEMAMVSTFAVWGMVDAGAPLGLAVLAVLVGSLLAGMALERAAIRPLRGRDPLSIIIATFGLSILLNSAAGMVWGTETRAVPSLFGDGVIDAAGVRLGADAVGTACTLLAVVGALWLLFARTQVGLSMRAAAVDPVTSRLLGVRADRMLMLGWGLAAAVGALAGVLVAPGLFLDVNLMSGVLIYALAALCLGGFDSPFGAVLGGWIVGLAQSLAEGYLDFIGTELAILVPFAVIMGVLLVRPSGLLGSETVVRP
jgi:branched-chain amino acid transport system permease protein